jgi:hypothetical protein
MNVIAFFLTPDLKNLHGLSLASHSGSLMLSYMIELYSDVMVATATPMPETICMALGIKKAFYLIIFC